jgi:hypothetical protein
MLSPAKVVGSNAGRRFLDQLTSEFSGLGPADRRRLPGFLVVGPGRTGTTWLARCLACHPKIFVPPEKELDYFSSNWQRFDIGWYLSFFAGREEFLKGEASPSYATLPAYRIRLLADSIPDLRIIVLLREPVTRAWSAAKHHLKTAGRSPDRIPEVPVPELIELLFSEGFAAADDYEGCLERWLAAFGHDRIFVGFTDDISRDPAALLRHIFEFLGTELPPDWSRFPLRQHINASDGEAAPGEVQHVLRTLFAPRVPKLDKFLRSRFDRALPSAWFDSIAGCDGSVPVLLRESSSGYSTYLHDGQFIVAPKDVDIVSLSAAQIDEAVRAGSLYRRPTLSQAEYVATALHDLDAHWLDAVHNHITEPGVWMVEQNFFGFNIVVWQHKCYAIAVGLGDLDLRQLSPSSLQRHIADKHIIVESTIEEVRAQVARNRTLPSQPIALVDATEQFNLVVTPSGAVAVSKALGPVDLFVERLGDREIGTAVLLGQTVDDLRDRVKAIEASSSQPPVSLIGEVGTYNLVRAGDRMLAVSRSLGEVRLFEERIGQRDLQPWILVGSSEAELRARIRAIENTRPAGVAAEPTSCQGSGSFLRR